MRGGSASDPSLAEILGVRLLLVNVLRPLAAGQRLTPEAFDKLLDEISEAKHATRWKVGRFRRKEIGDGNDKVGTQGNHHLAAAQPDLYLRGGIHGGRSYRTFSLLPVHLRQQPPTAVLHADLHPIERCGSNRNEPPRQLPDAHGGRSRNSTASGDERRRDRRHDAGTGRQAHPACALAARLAARLCSPLPGTGAELYRRVLECLSQECGLRWRWPFRSLQAPAAFRSAITGHPAPVFHRQGRSTAQGS